MTCPPSGDCVSGQCVCTGYLQISSPSAPPSTYDAVTGVPVHFAFSAPGCPSTQRFVLNVRQCCAPSALDCSGDPLLQDGCWSARLTTFTGTAVDYTFPSAYASSWYRFSVEESSSARYASPFLRVHFTR